jgi:hypothetical protein
MSRICGALAVAVALVAGVTAAAMAAKVTNVYGTATTTTESRGVEVAVDVAAAHQDPGADPFDVEVICVDASGMFKWLLTLDAGGRASISMLGQWRSASYYGADSAVVPGISLSLFLPPPLVDPGDRLLVSIDSDAITSFGPLFALAIDAYYTQPLRMDTLRVTLSTDADGNLIATATNLTHVPLIVPLNALTLGLAPTPDWIPETTPGIRWVPDPPLSLGLLVVGPDETVAVTLAMPAIPPASAAAYKNAMATLYAGIVDLYPGDYLAIGFPVAWGISWGYLSALVP